MKNKRVVAIVGTASTSSRQANDEPPEVERWTLFGGYDFLMQVDRFFEIHHQAHLIRNFGGNIAAHWARLAKADYPVYMQDVDPKIPTSVRYPIEEIIAEFGMYLTSSIAFMLALAIHERVDEIRIYGVDMDNWQEYTDQRSCAEYLIGYAKGRGITVTTPDGCPLLTAPLYGYSDGGAMDIGDLDVRARELEQNEKEARDMVLEAAARRDEVLLIKSKIQNTAALQKVMGEGSFEYVMPASTVETVTNGTAEGSRKVQAEKISESK